MKKFSALGIVLVFFMCLLIGASVLITASFDKAMAAELAAHEALLRATRATGYAAGIKEGIRRVQQSKGLPVSEDP